MSKHGRGHKGQPKFHSFKKNGVPLAGAPHAPAAAPAGAPAGAPTKHSLDAMQSMAVRLMFAREAIKQKNGFIAKLQASNGKRAKQDAERIGALEAEIADLTQQLMQTLINVENADNAKLAAEFQLPTGSVNYKQDELGNFYYETASALPAVSASPAAAPVQAASAALEDDEGDDEDLTPAQRRAALMAELEAMGDEGLGEPEAYEGPPEAVAEPVPAKG